MIEEMNTQAAPETIPEAAYQARLQAARETAEKHGYYWSVLSDEEKVEYQLALARNDFEQEIALIASKLKCLLPVYSYNLALLPRMLAILERLQRTQKLVFNKDDTSLLEQAVEKVLKRLSVPPALTGEDPGQSAGAD